MNQESSVALPALAVIPGDSMELWSSHDSRIDANLYGYTKGNLHKIELYDGAGRHWSVDQAIPDRHVGPIARFLAPICWNPRIKVALTFRKPRNCDLAKLKAKINRIVDLDDDVVTQFVEPETLKNEIGQAENVGDLIDVLKRNRAI